MKHIFIFILVLTLSHSKTPCDLNYIDNKTNEILTQEFNKIDPFLWTNLEKEFFHRLHELGLFDNHNDSLLALSNFPMLIMSSGYPKEFFVDSTKKETLDLLKGLDSLGLKNSETGAQKFLFENLSPILYECENTDQLSQIPRDFLIGIMLTNPDSLQISFDLALSPMNNSYQQQDFERPGLYKSIVIFYFNRMRQEFIE
jgi:hypothetical protein